MKPTAFPALLAVFFLAGCQAAGENAAATAESTLAAMPVKNAETVLRQAMEAVCPPWQGPTPTKIPTPTINPAKTASPQPTASPEQSDERNWSVQSTLTESSADCQAAAGHSLEIKLRWFEKEEEAVDSFDVRRGQNQTSDFHGFLLVILEEDDYSFPGGRKEHRVWAWQAGRWLVEVNAFDETTTRIAPDPGEASEEVYTAGLRYALWA
ncbi:MAG: hypothetical protein JW929_14625 [Anaerolineales bacterium]|nr:hypothetical protein [Anaerolineales bacterium]